MAAAKHTSLGLRHVPLLGFTSSSWPAEPSVWHVTCCCQAGLETECGPPVHKENAVKQNDLRRLLCYARGTAVLQATPQVRFPSLCGVKRHSSV